MYQVKHSTYVPRKTQSVSTK